MSHTREASGEPCVLSVVVPVYDEVDSLEPLHRELDVALSPLSGELELMLFKEG